jgi:hypothetical protein
MGERNYRTWDSEAEERLRYLVAEVEESLQEGEGIQAARTTVPAFGAFDSITHLAAELQVDRSALSQCLSGDPRAPHWRIRQQLDELLRLPPGGMTRVLSMVEKEGNWQLRQAMDRR